MSAVRELIESGVIQHDVPLGPKTTYRSGGPARLFAEVSDRATLEKLVASGLTADNRILVLGRGSNVVVSDQGFDGLVLSLGTGFGAIEITGTELQAGAAAPVPRVARASVDAGLTGLEFFVGIPGSVGGAVRQNAGCFGVETSDRLTKASLLNLTTGQLRECTPSDLGLSYRHSNLTADDLVVDAVFEAEIGDPEKGRAEIRRITRWRRDYQPGGTLNAGSVFKNPPEAPAGKIIDELGLKGTRVGGVSVSAKHANFFVAESNATSADIRGLVRLIKDQVFEKTGTMLEAEIQFVGFEDDD